MRSTSQQTVKRVFDYAFQQIPDAETAAILGDIPDRWGRMPPLSRAVVVEAGRVLKNRALLKSGRRLTEAGITAGLIGGTRKGSLATDMEFAATLTRGPDLASPALFGYTLPNIPLAEAANHYGLRGPVYAIFDSENPLSMAVQEAKRLLYIQKDLSLMLACEFDNFDHGGQGEQLSVIFTLVY
jgi:hypothetical protein